MPTYGNELEGAFSDFLDGGAYDKTEGMLFDLLRAAFVAGWQAAQHPATSQSKQTEGTEA